MTQNDYIIAAVSQGLYKATEIDFARECWQNNWWRCDLVAIWNEIKYAFN